jgi:hypothetical protein
VTYRKCGKKNDACTRQGHPGHGPLIWNIADEHFHGCTQTVDRYHARKHYLRAGKACWGNHKEKLNRWAERGRLELDADRVEAVIAATGPLSSLSGYNPELCERKIGCFIKIKDRVRYAEFRWIRDTVSSFSV